MTINTDQELKVAQLISKVIPHGYTTHSEVYAQIADLCQEIIITRELAHLIVVAMPEDLPVYDKIETAGLPDQIRENIQIELLKHPMVWRKTLAASLGR